MPYSEHEGIRIYFEERGQGSPLLLLNHIGASRLAWREEFLRALETSFRLLLPDQRGTGQSDKPDVPYSLRDMAGDTLSVLDTLAIPCTHLLGLSMGGAIAQELVLLAPDRIRGLVLIGTFCGPRKSVPAEPSVLTLFEPKPELSRREQIRHRLPAYYSRAFIETNEELLLTFIERGGADTPLYSLLRQNDAVQRFDSYDHLQRIASPTLVLHGTVDSIIPKENAQILAAGIPNAELVLMPGVGHVPMTEQPRETAKLVGEFLSKRQ